MVHTTSSKIVLTFILLSAACTSAEETSLSQPNRCGDVIECHSGEICIDNACHRLCSPDRGCPLSDICIGGLCHDGACGDGIQAGHEECDLGDLNSDTGLCRSDCRLNQCGDGFVYASLEECDDGNTLDGDGCSSSCTLPSSSTTSSESQNEQDLEETELEDIPSEDTPEESTPTSNSPEESEECESLLDCNGRCIADYHLSLAGDGFCDDNTDLINLNCAESGFDGGDCDNAGGSTTELDPSRSLIEKPSVQLSWQITPDFYQDEISWELYTYDGLFSLFLGSPASAEFNDTVILEKGSYCFSVYDSFGDGGSSGQLWLEGTPWHAWTATDYTFIHTTCFEVTFQDCPPGTTEDCLGQCVNDAYTAYLGDGTCDGGGRSAANFNCAAFHWDFIDCL